MIRRLVQVATLLSLGCGSGAAVAQTIEALSEAATIEERMRLRCPPADAHAEFNEPVRQFPSPDMAIWIDYSGADDVVRIAGAESEGMFNLGAGDDIALIYDAEGDTTVRGEQGADTILICSVADLYVSVDVNDYGLDTNPDVVIVESNVFRDVPQGMVRGISLTIDSGIDLVVIHHPADLPVDMNIQDSFTTGTIGNVEISFPMPGAAAVPTLVPE